jgi:steroid 5-alpha reductase family enzyme
MLFPVYFHALAVLAAAALLTWLVSLWTRNVAIVDSLWSPMFVLAAVVYALETPLLGPRAFVALALVGVWALRLTVHITWRNWGHGEDRRYQAIRARNEPHFAWKSVYLVFLLQAVLAWLISLPLLGAIAPRAQGSPGLGALDYAGMSVWLLGFVFEAGGDWQLSRFKADARNAGQVMDRGFWRWTRHPNYFGDFCVWWGLYLLALAAGAWWSIVGPLLMSVLLMRVSGVTLLEQDIGERRPKYADYVRRTNAFFPGPPRRW